ncbi:hypothetical protein ABPG75_012932 [Micractinium tetrahymenae]
MAARLQRVAGLAKVLTFERQYGLADNSWIRAAGIATAAELVAIPASLAELAISLRLHSEIHTPAAILQQPEWQTTAEGCTMCGCRYLPTESEAAAGGHLSVVCTSPGLTAQQLAALVPPQAVGPNLELSIDQSEAGLSPELAPLLASPALGHVRCLHIDAGQLHLRGCSMPAPADSRGLQCGACPIGSFSFQPAEAEGEAGGRLTIHCLAPGLTAQQLTALVPQQAPQPTLQLSIAHDRLEDSPNLAATLGLPCLSQLRSLELTTGRLHLEGAALPALRTLRVLGRRPSSLRLVAASLPALHSLEVAAGECVISDAALPMLRRLKATHVNLLISKTTLPALCIVDIHWAKCTISKAALPALLRLTMKEMYSFSIAKAALQALQVVEMRGGELTMSEAALPALQMLRLQRLAHFHLAGNAMPALQCVLVADDHAGEWLSSCLSKLPPTEELTVRTDSNSCPSLDIPSGPYLSGIESLRLCGAAFQRVPPVLAGAHRLHTLAIQGRHFKLTRADVDGILPQLPQLRRLHMPWRQADGPGTIVHLFRSMPQLEVPDELL